MKSFSQTTSVLIFALILFCSVSCKKNSDPPNNVISKDTTVKIVFTNNTFTTVNLTYEEDPYTITSKDSLQFIATQNSNYAYSGNTKDVNGGSEVDFGANNIITGIGGTTTSISFDIPSSYYYLVVNNASTVSVLRTVFGFNGNEPASGFIYTIPNDATNHSLGYQPSNPFPTFIDFSTTNDRKYNGWLFGAINGVSFTPVPPPMPQLSSTPNQELVFNLK